MDKPTVFISHISQEAKLAELFKNQIVQDFLGMIDVFVSSDGTSIKVGNKWLDDVDAALKNAKVELIICSQESVRRPWINFEAGACWVKGIPVVPVCHSGLRPADLPVPLNMLHGIEATDAAKLQHMYAVLASKLNSTPPKQSFKTFVKEVQVFESAYAETQEAERFPVAIKGSYFMSQAAGIMFTIKNTGNAPALPFKVGLFHPEVGSYFIFPSEKSGQLFPEQQREFRCPVVESGRVGSWFRSLTCDTHGELVRLDDYEFRLVLEDSEKVLYRNRRIGRAVGAIIRNAVLGGPGAFGHEPYWHELTNDLPDE